MREIKSLDEIKSIELSILKRVHSICEQNGIKYYLCGGTLLGAVRHKGFIPWDDDIDIYMKRRDYTKFVNLLKENAEIYAEEGLELVNATTPRYYGRIISKVIDNTTVLQENDYKTDDPIGIFIDIWPLDGTPNNNLYRKAYLIYATFIKKLLLAASMKDSTDLSAYKRLAIKTVGHINPKAILNHFDRIARRYAPENSEFLASYSDLPNLYKASEFRRRVMLTFEDTQFWAPAEYDSILIQDYGDYMKYPPESQRRPQHKFKAYYK